MKDDTLLVSKNFAYFLSFFSKFFLHINRAQCFHWVVVQTYILLMQRQYLANKNFSWTIALSLEIVIILTGEPDWILIWNFSFFILPFVLNGASSAPRKINRTWPVLSFKTANIRFVIFVSLAQSMVGGWILLRFFFRGFCNVDSPYRIFTSFLRWFTLKGMFGWEILDWHRYETFLLLEMARTVAGSASIPNWPGALSAVYGIFDAFIKPYCVFQRRIGKLLGLCTQAFLNSPTLNVP